MRRTALAIAATVVTLGILSAPAANAQLRDTGWNGTVAPVGR